MNVLEKCPGNGLTERKVVDKDKVSFRKSRKKYWMLQLRTVYPYGLNLDFGNNFKAGDAVIGINFPKIPKAKILRPNTRPNRQLQSNVFDPGQFLYNLNQELVRNLHLVPNKQWILIGRLKKSNLKQLYPKVKDLSKNSNYKQWI